MNKEIDDLEYELAEFEQAIKRTEAYEKIISSDTASSFLVTLYDDKKLRKDRLATIDPTTSIDIAKLQSVVKYIDSLINAINDSENNLRKLRKVAGEKEQLLAKLKKEERERIKKGEESNLLFPSKLTNKEQPDE